MCDAEKKCRRPEELKDAPEECSPEQIRKCHGEVAEHPCVTSSCEKPGNLEGAPEKCSPEQIRKCHGDVRAHPCTETR